MCLGIWLCGLEGRAKFVITTVLRNTSEGHYYPAELWPSKDNNTHGGRGVTLDDGNGRETRKNQNTHTAKPNKCIKVERGLFTASECLRGGLLCNIQQFRILLFFSRFGLSRSDLHWWTKLERSFDSWWQMNQGVIEVSSDKDGRNEPCEGQRNEHACVRWHAGNRGHGLLNELWVQFYRFCPRLKSHMSVKSAVMFGGKKNKPFMLLKEAKRQTACFSKSFL